MILVTGSAKKNSLGSEIIKSLVLDKKNHLFLTTRKGINKIDVISNLIISFNILFNKTFQIKIFFLKIL